MRVSYPQMNFLGIWHMPFTDAPYVCIEPWSALPSRKGRIEDLSEQPNLVHLPAGERYEIPGVLRFSEFCRTVKGMCLGTFLRRVRGCFGNHLPRRVRILAECFLSHGNEVFRTIKKNPASDSDRTVRRILFYKSEMLAERALYLCVAMVFNCPMTFLTGGR